jgi:hypothetical protein
MVNKQLSKNTALNNKNMTQTDPTSGVSIPKLVTVERGNFFPAPPAIAKELKTFRPELAGVSDYHIANKILTDKSFLEDVSRDIITNGSDDVKRKQYEADPKAFESDILVLQNNIRKSVSDSYLGGIDVKKSILKTSSRLNTNLEYAPSSKVKTGTVAENTGIQYADIGFVSSKYESGGDYGIKGDGPGDPTGAYGKYQISNDAGTLKTFLNRTKFKDDFAGLKPNTVEFDKKWQSLASNKDFQKEQDQFIIDTHFLPVESMYKAKGIDTSNVAIREAIFSSSVQHSRRGNEAILNDALKILGDERDPEKIVDALYKSRGGYVDRVISDNRVKTNLFKRYSSELETVKGLLGQYDRDVLPASKIRNAVERNPEQFPNFYDRFTKKANIPSGASGDKLLEKTAESDSDFNEKINETHLNSFEQELSRTHNFQISEENNPDLYAAAFAVWDGFGSEGLTKFINLIQFGPKMQNVRQEAMDKRYLDAKIWYSTSSINGVSPERYVGSFMNSLVIDPPKMSVIADYNVPKDFNAFSARKYKVNEISKGFDPVDDKKFVSDLVDHVYSLNTDQNASTQKLINSGKLTLEQIKSDVATGSDSYKAYGIFAQDVAYMAQKGQLDFTLQDVLDTISANGRYEKNPSLGDTFVIDDYKTAPASVKLAFDVLKQTDHAKKIIFRTEKGGLGVVLNREEAVGERDTYIGKAFRALTADEQVPVYDDNGQIIGKRTVAYNEGPWGIYNSVIAIPWSIAEVATNLVIQPLLEAEAWQYEKYSQIASSLGSTSGEQFFKDLSNKRKYWADLSDNFDVLKYDTKGFGEGLQLSDITGGVAEIAGIALAAKATGGAALSGVSSAFKVFNNVSKAASLGSRVAPAMQNVGKFERVNKILGKNNSKLWVGFLGVDALGGQNYSLMNSGLMGEDAERYYRSQSQAMRIGLDVMTGLALGEVFDWTLSAAATTGRRALRRGALRPGEGAMKETFSRTQVGEFVRDVSGTMRDLEVGDFKTAMAKKTQAQLDNSLNPEVNTLADVAVNFSEGANVYMQNLRQEIKQGLTKINNKASSSLSWTGRLSDADIEIRSQEMYQEMIDNMGKNIYNFFNQGRTGIDDRVWMDFSDMLSEMSKTTRIVPTVTDSGRPLVFDDISEAVSQTLVRDQNTNIVVSNGKFVQQLEDGRYGVYEIENYHWTKDLSESIKRQALGNVDMDEAVNLIAKAGNLNIDDVAQRELAVQSASRYNGRRTFSEDFEDVLLIGKIPGQEDSFLYRKMDGTLNTGRLAQARAVDEIVGEGAARTVDIEGEQIIDASASAGVKAATPTSPSDNNLAATYIQDNIEKRSAMKSQKLVSDRGGQAGKGKAPAGYNDSVKQSLARALKTSVDIVQSKTGQIAKKIGLDNIALLTSKSGKKGRIVAPGSSGKIQDWTPNSTVKKDVLVRHMDSDGLDSYWVADKKTNLEPSTWVYDESGRLMKNPDWHRMTENATFTPIPGTGQKTVKYYKLVDDGRGLFKETDELDPDGVILNIQKPVAVSVDDINNAKYLDNDFIMDNNIDGYYTMIDGVPHFKPVSPIQQVYTTDELMDNIVLKAEDAIVPEVSTAVRLGAVIVGSVGGSLSTGMFDDEEVSAASGGIIGGILGLLGGGRRGRQVVRNVRNITKAQKDTDLPREIENALNSPANSDDFKRASELGYAGRPSDVEEVNGFNRHVGRVTEMISRGATLDAILRNEYTQNSFGFLSGLDSPTARQLRDILYRVNDKGVLYRAMPSLVYESGKGKGIGAYVADNKEGVMITKNFMTQNEAIIDHAARNGIQIDDFYAKDKYDEFSSLMLETGGRMFNDVSNAKAADFYRYNPHLEELHRALLQDPRFKEIYDAKRNMLETVKRDYLSAIKNVVGQQVLLLDRGGVDAQEFIAWATRTVDDSIPQNDRISYRTYMDRLKKDDKPMYQRIDEYVNNSNRARHIRDLADTYHSFQEFGDRYYTQLLDKDKIEVARQRFMTQNASNYASEKEANAAFEKQMVDRFVELNATGAKSGRRYLFEYDESIGDVVELAYENVEQALSKLNRILDSRSGGLSDDDVALVRQRFTNEAFIKGDDDMYRIDFTHPSLLDQNGESIFKDYEYAHIKNLVDNFVTGSFSRKSNFLDRQRKFVTPFEWQVTDQDRWLYRYTNDVGQRIHMLENGISDTTSLRNNYFEKIRKELAGKVDQKTLEKYINRIEGIYNVQMGLIKSVFNEETLDGRVKAMGDYIRNERLASTVRNFTFGAFAPGIAYLDAGQPLVFGSTISSMSSILQGYNLLRTNREQFNNLVRLSETFNVATKKLELINPSVQMDVDDAISSGYNYADKVYRLSKRAADFGSGFSLMGVAHKALGLTFDPNNWGLMRLASDFYTVNATSTTINWYGAVIESGLLAKALRDMGTDTQTVINGKTMTRRDIMGKLNSLGISSDKVDRFVRNSERFENMIGDMKTGKTLSKDEMEKFPSLYEDLNSIINTSTDVYHGRNKMNRPEWWTTPIGKLLTQFSVYPMNFAAQIYTNRVYRPIADWMAQHNAKIDSGATPMKILYAMSTKNYKKLRDWGFDDQAIKDLPLDAWHSVIKGAMAVSMSAAVLATRDAMMDAVNAGANAGLEAAGVPLSEDTYFTRTKRVLQREDGSPAWEYNEISDGWEMFMWGSQQVAKTGAFGKWGDIFFNPFSSRDGIVSISGPSVSLINDTYRLIGNPSFKEGGRIVTRVIPGAGSYNLNRFLRNGAFEQEKLTGRKNFSLEPAYLTAPLGLSDPLGLGDSAE